jgi:nucleotide-binding universal stress UspA family protein
MTYKNIVVGTNLSETARVATDRAAMLARRLDANLTLIYAGRSPGYPLGALGRTYGADYKAVPGAAAEVLVGESEKLGADLLVVGSVGMTGARRFMLGSVPNKVSHAASIDVLIVKSDFELARTRANEYRRLLIGTDGSETAMRAVDVGSAIAAALGANPVILCAFGSTSVPDREATAAGTSQSVDAGDDTADDWHIGGASHAREVLERAAERSERMGAVAEVRAVEGAPADALLSVADDEDFDLIVVGNVGMTGAKRFMLANVPHRISHQAPVDVLILRTK